MDYPNKKDISFIDIYDDEVATYPRAVTYTGTVSTDSQDSKVLIADSDGDGFTTNFVEFGNNLVGFEEIRKGYYVFNGTEIRQVKGVTPSQQAITLDAPFTTPLSGDGLYVIKPILIDKISFKNTGDTAGSVYTKASPTALSTYSSTPLKPGEVISFDNSSLTPFVVDATATTVKLSNAFFFDVTDTINASGGGTPAGSDNQIQINQSGSFFADNKFQKSDTGFNVGLDHTTQSAVTFTGSGLDDLTLSGTFSGTYPTTYTVTVSSTGTPDTFDWTDGTNSGTGVSMSTSSIPLSNDVEISFNTDTGHTLSDEWTWTYSYVNQNVLDFSNNDYKFQSTFGDETISHTVTDNLFGSGKNAILTQFTVPLGSLMDYAFSDGGDITSTKTLSYPSSTATTESEFSYNKYSAKVTVGTDQGNLYITSQQSQLTKITDLDGVNYYKTGFTTTVGYAKVGDIDGGNSTYIKVDDLNEQITISNLPAFDDDAAAGTAGLTAGMVYMTTGSGSAPLNVSGILMIKQ